MKPKTIFILVLVSLFGIIIFQNRSVVDLQLLFWKIEMSRIIFYSVVLVFGVIIGGVLASLYYAKKITKLKSENFLNKNNENNNG